MSAVARKLNAHLEKYGTPKSEIARGVGVNRATVYTWLSGEITPRGKHLKALAEMLECSVDDLVKD